MRSPGLGDLLFTREDIYPDSPKVVNGGVEPKKWLEPNATKWEMIAQSCCDISAFYFTILWYGSCPVSGLDALQSPGKNKIVLTIIRPDLRAGESRLFGAESEIWEHSVEWRVATYPQSFASYPSLVLCAVVPELWSLKYDKDRRLYLYTYICLVKRHTSYDIITTHTVLWSLKRLDAPRTELWKLTGYAGMQPSLNFHSPGLSECWVRITTLLIISTRVESAIFTFTEVENRDF